MKYSAPSLLKVGSLGKSHGVKGEINFYTTMDPENFVALVEEQTVYLFVSIDNLTVPYAVESVRTKGNDALLVTLQGIEQRDAADSLAGLEVFLETHLIEQQEELETAFLSGFTLYDSQRNLVGTILSVDDQTANILLVVEPVDSSAEELLIPIADELIVDIDLSAKSIVLEIPQGLLP